MLYFLIFGFWILGIFHFDCFGFCIGFLWILGFGVVSLFCAILLILIDADVLV